jgi:hypothetical protein
MGSSDNDDDDDDSEGQMLAAQDQVISTMCFKNKIFKEEINRWINGILKDIEEFKVKN